MADDDTSTTQTTSASDAQAPVGQGNDLSSLALTALQNLVVAVNGLTQAVQNAPT